MLMIVLYYIKHKRNIIRNPRYYNFHKDSWDFQHNVRRIDQVNLLKMKTQVISNQNVNSCHRYSIICEKCVPIVKFKSLGENNILSTSHTRHKTQ